jgi:hypothetical protein
MAGKRKAEEDENKTTKEERREQKRQKKEVKQKRKEEKKKLRSTEDDREIERATTTRAAAPEVEACHEWVDDGNAVLYRKKVTFIVSLLPAALTSVQMSVEDSLRSMLLKHSDGIGGILLAFENVQILSDSHIGVAGTIINEFPYIHYNVAVDALVFVPKPGCPLTGAVTEISFHSHVAMVVHHYFNASISAEHMRAAGFAFDEVQLQWYDESNQTPLSLNNRIVFKCEKMFESGGIISIEGSTPKLLDAAQDV